MKKKSITVTRPVFKTCLNSDVVKIIFPFPRCGKNQIYNKSVSLHLFNQSRKKHENNFTDCITSSLIARIS